MQRVNPALAAMIAAKQFIFDTGSTRSGGMIGVNLTIPQQGWWHPGSRKPSRKHTAEIRALRKQQRRRRYLISLRRKRK